MPSTIVFLVIAISAAAQHVDAVSKRFREHVHTHNKKPVKSNVKSGLANSKTVTYTSGRFWRQTAIEFLANTDVYTRWPTVLAEMARVETDPANQAYLQQWLTDPKAEYMEFGLRIAGNESMSISGPKLKNDWVSDGCGDGNRDCQCAYKLEPNTHKSTFYMYGKSDEEDKLHFRCEGVTFRAAVSGVSCTCTFEMSTKKNGVRTFDDDCQPQFCLRELFDIYGGNGIDIPDRNSYQIYSTSMLTGKPMVFPSCCDKDPYCASFDKFKYGFQNRDGSGGDKKYGTQHGNGRLYTRVGLKWFYGLTMAAKLPSGRSRRNTLSGRWTPTSSGGQASFTEGMHWDESSSKSKSSEVSKTLSASCGVSYGPVSMGAEASQSWTDAAENTNAETKGGSSSRTCAAYQCEGGTTWQWKMDLNSPTLKVSFDNCVFVCTPNQGQVPRCPFGFCCSSENRLNECAQCSKLWCDVDDPHCPFHPDHPEHEDYCGKRDEAFISFLRTLRSGVETWFRTLQHEDRKFKQMKELVHADAKAQHLLQSAYKRFEASTSILGKAGVDEEEKEIQAQVKTKLKHLTSMLMKHQLKEVDAYTKLAADQAADFDDNAKKDDSEKRKSDSLSIKHINLTPSDFSFSELKRANKRLRMDCYYEQESKIDASERQWEKNGGLGPPKSGKSGKQETLQPSKPVKSSPEAAQRKLRDVLETQRVERAKKKTARERDTLFKCFRDFFLAHQHHLFTLENLDHMLVQETASCEDRVINPKCKHKHPTGAAKADSSEIEELGAVTHARGGGAEAEGVEVGDAAETAGVEVEAAEAEGGGGVCCLQSGAKAPTKAACDGDGDKEVLSSQCAPKSLTADKSVPNKQSLTADKNVQDQTGGPVKNAQDAHSFEREQAEVKAKRNANPAGKNDVKVERPEG